MHQSSKRYQEEYHRREISAWQANHRFDFLKWKHHVHDIYISCLWALNCHHRWLGCMCLWLFSWVILWIKKNRCFFWFHFKNNQCLHSHFYCLCWGNCFFLPDLMGIQVNHFTFPFPYTIPFVFQEWSSVRIGFLDQKW